MIAMYEGDGNFLAANSPEYVQAVNRIATTLVLASTYPPAPVYGGPVELVATVSPANVSSSSTINFTDNAGFWAVGNPIGGVLRLYPVLPAGSHAIVGTFSGDGLFAPSASTPLTVNVAKATPVVTLTSALNPSMQGQDLLLTATVSPSSDGAVVQFLDGTTVIGSAVLHGATVSYNAWLGAGRHYLTAVCAGDKNLLPASSPVLDQTVQATTVLAIRATPGPLVWGQSVTFSASVGNAAATGTIEFTDGAVSLGVVPISGAAASVTVSTLAVGDHRIAASYAGDGIYLPSSGSLSVTIGKATPTIALTSAPNPAAGQSFVLTSNLTPSSVSGTVQFLDGATVLGTVAVAAGTGSFTTPILTPGSHSFTAIYSGDANFNTVTSAAVAQTIKADTSVSLGASPNPSVAGQPVVFTAAVSPSGATGTVQFLDGATVIGTAAVANGTASIAANALAAGSHSVTAAYSGDAAYKPATSLPVVQLVKQSTTTTLAADTATPLAGQTVRFTATVAPNSATGSVQFLDGGTPLVSVVLVGGTATLAVPTLSVGSHSITAAYSGDANHEPSASAVLAVTVSKAPAAVTLASSLNPSVAGQPVTLAAIVTPLTANGTVQFLDGATVVGVATITDGTARLSGSTLAVGTHSITAVYGGDARTASAASSALAQVVKPVAPSNLAVTGTTSSTIKLTFTPSPTPGVTSYRIYGSSTPGVTTQSLLYAVVSGSPVSLTDITSGTTTYFVITAWGPDGESFPSNEVVAVTKGKAR